jgi:hypothetical protein
MLDANDMAMIENVCYKSNSKLFSDIQKWSDEKFVFKTDPEYNDLKLNIKFIYLIVTVLGIPIVLLSISSLLKLVT